MRDTDIYDVLLATNRVSRNKDTLTALYLLGPRIAIMIEKRKER